MNIEEDFKMDNLSVRRFCEQDLSSIMFDLSQEDEDFLFKLPEHGHLPSVRLALGQELKRRPLKSVVHDLVTSCHIACTVLDDNNNVLSVTCAGNAVESTWLGVGALWSFSSSRLDCEALRSNPALVYELLRCSVDIAEFMNTLYPVLLKMVLKSSVRANRAAVFCGFELYRSCEYFNYYRRTA